MKMLVGIPVLALASAASAQDAPSSEPVIVVFDEQEPEPAAPESAVDEDGSFNWGFQFQTANRANCSDNADIIATTGTDAPRYDAQGNLIRTDHCQQAASEAPAPERTGRRIAWEPDVRQECHEDENSSGCSSSVSFGTSDAARQSARDAIDALRADD